MRIFSMFAPMLLFVANTDALAAINPSQAFSTALSVAESELLHETNLPNDVKIYQISSIGIGKYAPNEFGDYGVALNVHSLQQSTSYECVARMTIERVVYAMHPFPVIILEEVRNDYQIIAHRLDFGCKPQ